ncbi:hypothetical protein NM962_01140 [Mycobacterium sp. SVM_VP21]|nr:hypothetical protein NM962_01140 [Mycobacterium sp. SVM_VP21]
MTFTQGPNDILDYTVDWTKWLPTGDTIASSTWSVENVTPPVNLTLVGTANTGGELASGTRCWCITAIDDHGETTPSNVVSATFTAANGLAQLEWPAVPNATGIYVYAGATPTTFQYRMGPLPASATTFTDDGRAPTASAAPPMVNTAALGVTIAAEPEPAFTDTTATAFVQGGSVGVVYDVTNHITTAAGRQASISLQISIQEQYVP